MRLPLISGEQSSKHNIDQERIMAGSSFGFLTAADIRFGRGMALAGVKDLANLGAPLLLVHGSNSKRADWLRLALLDQDIQVQCFAVAGEPDIEMITKGVEQARAGAIAAVVSLGGGSVVDAGKALAALIPATRPMLDHLEVVGQGLPLDVAPLPFAALPTTAGTGAEVTKNAVLSVPEARRKVSLRDSRMLPDIAIVDASLTDNLPRSVTLASGLDAVTQVIEPYLSCKANWLTDALCRDAIPKGLEALATLMQTEAPAARDALAWTSLAGGLALANAGLGAVHGLAGVLGGVTGGAHGALCGTLLPHVLASNHARLHTLAEEAPLLARFDEVQHWIAAAIDCDHEQAFESLKAWSANLGLPALAQLGLDKEQIPSIASASLVSSSMKGNPVPLSQSDLEGILFAAL
ncbi:iron-containing alcohol dehydrogenase [Cohaesibacter celericrescens]|nr:iron-containing alcohol dehydrogenase [Cohaesibacter celericrescens]